jgi:hypothetical protein
VEIVTEAAAQAWLDRAGWPDLSVKCIERELTFVRAFRIPPDSGQKTVLARQICFCLETGPWLLAIAPVGTWPSSECMPLFDGYRRSLGEQRPLAEAPCHIATEAEREPVQCLLSLALYFVWDATLIGPSQRMAVVLSHDEWVSVYCGSAEAMAGIDSLIGSFYEPA